MKTTIDTGEDERLVITTGDRVVNILRQYLVAHSDPPRWKTDPEAGLCFSVEHGPAVAAAMVSTPMPGEAPAAAWGKPQLVAVEQLADRLGSLGVADCDSAAMLLRGMVSERRGLPQVSGPSSCEAEVPHDECCAICGVHQIHHPKSAMRKALEWYANVAHYVHGPNPGDESDASEDSGTRARAALKAAPFTRKAGK